MTVPMTLESPVFADGGEIPMRYTGEGNDVSPPLFWSGVPEATQSLVLIIDDPDAPDPAAPQRVWVHWLLYNIAPTEKSLPEDLSPMTVGMREGLNDFGWTRYGGPMPPIGRHRYFHKLYALDTALDFAAPPSKSVLEKAMEGHILAQASLIGTYQLKR